MDETTRPRVVLSKNYRILTIVEVSLDIAPEIVVNTQRLSA